MKNHGTREKRSRLRVRTLSAVFTADGEEAGNGEERRLMQGG